jgi:hypothetical protein
VEELDEWYEDVVRLLGLEDEVASGWDQESKFWHSTEPCFHAIGTTTCDGPWSGVLYCAVTLLMLSVCRDHDAP